MVRVTIVLILAILSKETLASPLNLEVSINEVQNGNSTEGSSAGACIPEFEGCQFEGNPNCCKGLECNCFDSRSKQLHSVLNVTWICCSEKFEG